MARFLFTLWDGDGSLPPELTVVRQVVAAGHTVTVVGDPVIETEVRATGVTDFRPWVDAPLHETRRAEDDYIRDWELRNPIRVLANLMDTPMVTPAPRFVAETLAVIDGVRPDVVAFTSGRSPAHVPTTWRSAISVVVEWLMAPSRYSTSPRVHCGSSVGPS